MKKIILTGNPNVGKSVIFSHLTNLGALSSNYPGTTVELLKGKAVLAKNDFELVDVPGAYSLDATNKAEEAAGGIINSGDYALTINVLDATALERNLFFALSLLERKTPLLFLLNKCDLAKNRGIKIDPEKLSSELGARVIPVIATTGEGFDKLNLRIGEFLEEPAAFLPSKAIPEKNPEKWKLIGEISSLSQKIEHKHPCFLEKLETVTTTPHTAIPFGFVVLLSSILLIRFIGENLTNFVLDPLFNSYYAPFLAKLSAALDSATLKALLFGSSPVPMESFGLLTTGLYVPFVVVLPYILAFYLILSLLEDIGYLPRIAVILDNLSHRIGLHGYGTIPIMMGLGCKVPGLLATRVLETKKEKIIASSLLFLMAPCMPQSAMIFSILSPYPVFYTLLVFGYIFFIGLVAGLLLNRLIKQETPELFIEIPSYQTPNPRLLFFKLRLRLRAFLIDAVPLIMLGILAINLLDIFGVLSSISSFFSPFFTKVLRLPGEMGSVIILGFLKKDVSISMLAPFHLAPAQLAVASVFLAVYLPCVASLFLMIKELGAKSSFYVAAFNLAAAVLFSALLAFLLNL